MKNLSLKVKLLVISIVLAVIPSVAVGGFAFMSAYDGVKDVTKQNLTYIIHLETKLLAKSVEAAKTDAELKQQVEATLLDFKQNYYEKNNQVGYGYVLDPKGVVLFHPDPTYIGVDFSKETFIQDMITKKTGYLEYEWKGQQKVAAFAELPNGWIFSASAYLTDMMAPIAPIQQDVIVTCLVAAVVASIVAFFIVRYLTKPMQEVIHAMEAVGEGDLTNDVPIRTNDEIGRISAMYNEMLHKLRAILTNISEASQQVASSSEQLSASADENARASEQIATAAEEISRGSQDQVERVNTVVDTIHGISDAIASTSDNVKKIDEDSKSARHFAEDGMNRLALVVDEMSDITNKVRNTERVIRELGQQSESIMGIITAIRDISEQTNLLALNAAIEAARAGEQGKSFAVVAGEVRKLAEQSGRSADDIANLIVTINSEIHQATEMMKASTEAVADGERVVQTASSSFKNIMTAVIDVNEEMDELAKSMKDVEQATKGIIQNVVSISEVAASAAGDTEEVAAASEEQTAAMEEITAASQMLAKMAERLQWEVGQFKL